MSIELDTIIGWLIANWIWPAVIVGAIVVLFIVLALLPDAKMRTSAAFPVTGDEARELAVGAIQITTSLGAWNDPEAHAIRQSATLRRNLTAMWGLDDRDEWLETIRELPVRRSEPLRDGLLELRARLADTLGRRPSKKEWVAAAQAEGAAARPAGRVIDSIITLERALRTRKLGTLILPDSATIGSTRRYAYGQAAALATWGVALGFATREEIRPILTRTSEQARADFGSWEEFGRSYLLGRSLRLVEQGMDPAKAIDTTSDGLLAYSQAFDVNRGGGPWATLPW